MLSFNNHPIVSDDVLGCKLLADEATFGAVQFSIGPTILSDVLHGRNPVHHYDNLKLCDRERPCIEAACRHAFAVRPSARIDLEPSDFRAK